MINSLSSGSRLTVASLIGQMKTSKQSADSALTKLNTFRIDTNFSPVTMAAISSLNKLALIDMHRDADLRIGRHYGSVNLISLLIHSMVDIFSAEIEKIEKDIKVLEDYIDSYEYISGKDDLFNSSYVEKFDNFASDYRADGDIFPLTDRDDINFNEDGNGFIDSKSGMFKIGKNLLRKNIFDLIDSYSISTNYDDYIKTNTGLESALNDILTDAWTITAKTPYILTSKLSAYSKYISYSTKNIVRSPNNSGNKILISRKYGRNYNFPQYIQRATIIAGSCFSQ